MFFLTRKPLHKSSVNIVENVNFQFTQYLALLQKSQMYSMISLPVL